MNGASGPIICHHCWPTQENWYQPCEHVLRVCAAARREGAKEMRERAMYCRDAAAIRALPLRPEGEDV